MKLYTELGLDITYHYTPACKGERENGVPIEPDFAAEIDITSIKWRGIVLDKFTEEEIQDYEKQCFEDVDAANQDAAESRAELNYSKGEE